MRGDIEALLSDLAAGKLPLRPWIASQPCSKSTWIRFRLFAWSPICVYRKHRTE